MSMVTDSLLINSNEKSNLYANYRFIGINNLFCMVSCSKREKYKFLNRLFF